MESKRNRDEEDHQNNDDNNLQIPAKRRCCDTDNHALLTVLEPLLRKLVEELIPPMLQRYVSPCCRLSHNHPGGSSGVRPLQLCFLNELPQTIFTMGNLTAEDGGTLKIELRNAASQQRVDTGEVSTMKARIYVLDGDFGNEEWTAEEFRAAIVKPRPSKGSLLKGEPVIKLEKGIGFINNTNNKSLAFTDNSCTTRSKKYRLGVQIEESNSLGAGIREAISEPFRVKDNRVESIKKHDRPSLDDKVWRLKHIGRGGRLHRQLSDNGIKTVKDLLRVNTTGLLQEKFSKINALDRIIAHAKYCEVDDNERYSYTYMEQLLSVSLVFNCIYEVVEVIFNGQQPRSLESLNSEEKGLVERIKRKAYQNLQNVKPIEIQTHDIVKKVIDIQEASYRASDQVPFGTLPSTSTSIMDDSNLNLSFGEQVVPREAGINIIDYGNEWIPNVTDIEEFERFEIYFDPKPNPSPYQWDQHDFSHFAAVDDGASCSNGFFSPDSAGCMTNKRKTKTVWQKIRNALKVLSPYLAKRKRPILFCGQN